MDEINNLKRQKQHRLYQICVEILECIRAQVRIASGCRKREIDYPFYKLNTRGCPMTSSSKASKIKKFVVKKLEGDGFHVLDATGASDVENVEWALKVKW